MHPEDPSPPTAPRVRLWHFVLFPMLGMGAVLVLARIGEKMLPPDLEPALWDIYHVGRTVVISLVMTSLIGWLAIRYRRHYEVRLQARADALEETRQFLTRIIETSAEAIVTLDTELRITSWNRAAGQIYGWTSDDMIGESLRRLLPEGDAVQAETNRVDQQVRDGQTLRDYQAVHVRRDGRRITVRMTVSPFLGEGSRYQGSTAIIRDVTSLIGLEKRVREQDRLAAVGRLAAQVAHEIKNPLAGIRGACEVMIGRLKDDPGQEVAEEIIRQIDRLNRTVEELLVFSRRPSSRPVPSDLHEVIDAVIGVVTGATDAKGLTVARSFDPALEKVTVDPEQMQQVLFNVVLNAAQIMDYDGTLTVETQVDEKLVKIFVRDTGPGLPAGPSTTIFEPFYTTRAQGTGLGLAIVRKIVHAHDGTVDARNLPGSGAEFEIRLPYR